MDLQNLFWICWAGEMLGVLYWITSEIKLKVNPIAVFSAVYLLAALVLRVSSGTPVMASVMVIIPAMPLSLMLFVMMVHSVSEGKPNVEGKKFTEL